MTNIIVGATSLSPDEPCFGLCEMNLQAPDNKGFRRYQIIYVVRNDRVAEFRRDLGPAGDFKADQFRIPGGIIDPVTKKIYTEETVGRLTEIAEQLRERVTDWKGITEQDLIRAG